MSLAVLLLLQVATGQPASGHDVVARMHDRWQGKWFRTLTFVQRTRFPDGSAQTWYETVANPGRLRIDFGPVDSMNSAIMKHDSIFQFKRGKPLGGHPYPSMLGVALSDVYTQPVAETVAQLERGGVDLFKLRADTLRGRRAWVIGAVAGDSTAPQLWIDQERLLLLGCTSQVPTAPSRPPKCCAARPDRSRSRPRWHSARTARKSSTRSTAGSRSTPDSTRGCSRPAAGSVRAGSPNDEAPALAGARSLRTSRRLRPAALPAAHSKVIGRGKLPHCPPSSCTAPDISQYIVDWPSETTGWFMPTSW